jgi:hypothetical protein
VAAQFLFWKYFLRIFGIVSLQGTSRETVSFISQNTLYCPYLSLAVALNRMQYGVSFENFEELLLPYPLVSSAKKLVGGEISESLKL